MASAPIVQSQNPHVIDIPRECNSLAPLTRIAALDRDLFVDHGKPDDAWAVGERGEVLRGLAQKLDAERKQKPR